MTTLSQMRARALSGHYGALRALNDGRPVIRPGAYASEIRGMRTVLATLRRWGAIDTDGNVTDIGRELLTEAAMPNCKCGHPSNRHGLGHPCNVPGCPCPFYRAQD